MTFASRFVIALAVASLLAGAGVPQAAAAPKYAVTVTIIDRNGKTPTVERGSVTLQNAKGDYHTAHAGETMEVARGSYLAVATVDTARPGKLEPSVTMLTIPNVDVTKNRPLVLDARRASRVQFTVDKPDARPFRIGAVSRRNGFPVEENVELDGTYDEFYAGSAGPDVKGFEFYLRAQLFATDARLETPNLDLDVWWLPAQPRIVDKEQLTLVDVGAGVPADIAKRDVKGKAVVVTPTEESDVSATARAIAKAGGRLAVFWFQPGLVTGIDGRVLPALYTTRAEGAKLVGLAKQSRKIDVEGLSSSPYRYDLTVPTKGNVPKRPGGTFHDADLAQVNARYVNASPTQTIGYTYDYPEIGGRQYPFPAGDLYSEEFALPMERTEYSTPAVWWARSSWESVSPPLTDDITGSGNEGVRQLGKGEPKALTTGAPVIGPWLAGPYNRFAHSSWVSRDDTDVEVVIPLLSDGWAQISDPDLDQTLSVDKGFTKLIRNGKLVKTVKQAGRGGFTIPKGPATLRIITDFTRKAAWWPTSTKITGSWTVSSKGNGILPLMAVRFRPETDLHGDVTPSDATQVPIWIQRERGAPASAVKSLEVQVSYDDGKTWTKAPLTTHPASWTAQVKTTAGQYVSLRAKATDAAGNSVDQLIIRAFHVRAAEPTPTPTATGNKRAS